VQEGKIADMDYYNISAFTLEQHKQGIIEDIRKTSAEEVPMIWFLPLDGNEEFLGWIEKSLS